MAFHSSAKAIQIYESKVGGHQPSQPRKDNNKDGGMNVRKSRDRRAKGGLDRRRTDSRM